MDRSFVIAAIPAFNEDKTIAKVVLLAQKHTGMVVVCDDGSTDMTAPIAERLGAVVIKHEKNMGYGESIQTLFERAREENADIMVTLDGDMQHDPDEIPRLLTPILEGVADIVIGSRFLVGADSEVPAYRRLGIGVITKLVGGKGVLSDAQSGFRAYGRKAIESLRLLESGMGISAEILMRASELGLRMVEVPIGCRYRGLETSTHDPLRHGASVIMSVVRLVIEERPLLCLGVPGTVSLLLGVLFGGRMLQLYAIEGRIVTNVALASIAFVLIGLFVVFSAVMLYAINRLLQKAYAEGAQINQSIDRSQDRADRESIDPQGSMNTSVQPNED